jgi:RNA-directed DNA polymerase
MLESFRGRNMLRYLWYSQHRLCPVCTEKITQLTGWRMHYCVPRTSGGSPSSENRVLLHPECHSNVHHQGLTVSTPRSSEAFEGLEPCEGKLSRTVLRGLDGTNPVQLLDLTGS